MPASLPTRLTLIIVNYNVRDLLRDCLKSVEASHNRSEIDVIVVDNRSSDGSAGMVRAEFPTVRLIESPSNAGFAAANNLGIKAAGEAAYVMLLNPDTVVPPDALARMLSYMDANPGVGVLGPKLVLASGKLDLACRRSFPDPRIAFYHASGLDKMFPRSREFARYNLTFLDENQLAEVDCVVGAAMMVRSEAIAKAGLLDESFFMYGEDLDWAFRIHEAGWKVIYNPDVVIVHYKGQSSRQRSFRSILAFYDAMVTFHRKHYAAQMLPLANWAIMAGIRLRLLVALAVNLFRPRAAAHAE
ncbi:MAG: glycosyltransferase family 2 protein [Chloroflexi bacterium]|nr:glycosyltransferase family 2 protein [Chloroflexota bacterium]